VRVVVMVGVPALAVVERIDVLEHRRVELKL
jgi:hypothetical protein